MRSSYYLHKRKDVYYAELVTPDGYKLSPKSTGKTTEKEALLVVSEWLTKGLPAKDGKSKKSFDSIIGLDGILKAIRKNDLDGVDAMKIVNELKKQKLIDVSIVKAGKGAKLFTDFLLEFWDYDTSPYVKEVKASGQNIHKAHCYDNARRVKQFFLDYFKDRPLYSITRQDLKDFSIFLAEKREKPEKYKGNFKEYLSASYRNSILLTAKTALKWAFNEELIPADPTAGIKKISGISKKRGILTESEAAKIFNEVEWDDYRAYCGNLLACTTGLRMGEVLALKKSDILYLKDSCLIISYSWSRFDKLKSTKTNKERKVIIYPEVKEKLLELIKMNPHKTDDAFIFYSALPDQPVDKNVLLFGLFKACTAAKIDYKGRNIVFHSHRHYYSANMADKIDPKKVQRITGHVTQEVFDEYADHELENSFEEVSKVGEKVFSNILKFKKAS